MSHKSEDHLLTRHGHVFGINDILPRDPNQKATKHPSHQIRTRVNKQNRGLFKESVQKILSNKENTKLVKDVSIRGINGDAYYCLEQGCVIAVHKEGKFNGQIMKAQSMTLEQYTLLLETLKLN